jgi:hypothetical protein
LRKERSCPTAGYIWTVAPPSPLSRATNNLKGIKTEPRGVQINCNAGAITTNKRGTYGNLKVWYLPDGIANIISMHELEEM